MLAVYDAPRVRMFLAELSLVTVYRARGFGRPMSYQLPPAKMTNAVFWLLQRYRSVSTIDGGVDGIGTGPG